MKNLKLSILSAWVLLFFYPDLNACDLSNATLNNVVSAGNGEYLITVTYCAGSGQNSSRYGGDQNSAAFGFHLVGAVYSSTNPISPLAVTSSTTGAVYNGYIYDPSWAIFDNNLSQWWACVNGGCGPVQSTCATITLRTIGLPTSIEVGGAEAAGIVVPPYGCNGMPDMIVHPPCFGFTVNAGADRTVFYGYAPQACTTISAVPSGISGPFTYLWSNSATTSSINVCPAATTTYSVTVTAANGCVATDQVVVTSVNVICGTGKVRLCHGTTTKCVKTNQVAGHLSHGDQLGACSNKTDEFEVPEVPGLSFYPNPVTSSININFTAETAGNTSIEVVGMNGTTLATVFKGALEMDDVLEFKQDLSSFPPGIYLLRSTHPDGKTEFKKFIVTK